MYYQDSDCSTISTDQTTTTNAGYTCSESTSSGISSSQFQYCNFKTPLPDLTYSNVMLTEYITAEAIPLGCNGQPNKITTYPVDNCVSNTGSSYKFSCPGSTPTYYNYMNSGCASYATPVPLPSLCTAAQYTDDDADDITTGDENIQYVCNIMDSSSNDDDGLTGGDIAGVVIAVLIFSGFVAACGFYAFCTKKNHGDGEETDRAMSMNPMSAP